MLSLSPQVCSLWKFPVEHTAVSSDVHRGIRCATQTPGDATFWTGRLTVQVSNWCNTDCPISQPGGLSLFSEISRVWGFFHLTLILINKLSVCDYFLNLPNLSKSSVSLLHILWKFSLLTEAQNYHAFYFFKMAKLFFNVFFPPTNIYYLAHNPIMNKDKRHLRNYSIFCLFSPLVNY